MKKILLFCVAVSFAAISFSQTPVKSPKRYSKLVKKTEKKLTKYAVQSQLAKGHNGTPDLYWIQEFIATMDPVLKRPTPEVLAEVFAELNKQEMVEYGAMPGTSVTAWVERGPNNVGGRTRALAWDPTDATGKKVWAGGISGGLWYNNDITSSSSSWQHVSSVWNNLAVSAIAFDPNAPGTIYIGTGEGYTSSYSAGRGYGIWKSTDSGKTFSQLSSTTTYYYINDILVRNESGSSVVYAAVDANYYSGDFHGLTSYGLYRSTNGGTSWTNVIGNAPNSAKYSISDLELAADNTIWAGTRNNLYSGTDKGGGRIMNSSNGTTWTTKYTLPSKPGRVELACAPGSSSLVYAVFEYAGKTDTMLVTHDKGSTWAKLNKPDDADDGISKWDFTRNQAWYDLILKVDPNDTNTLLIGGIDVFRSTNGGSSWSQIGKWSNNNNLASLPCSYVHADQHEIAFKPGSSSTCIFGNDGGVFYTANLSSAASSDVISERNKNYSTVQFYCGDIAAASGSNLMVGGAQDNGTHRLNAAGLSSSTKLAGGDGGACFISASNVSRQIASYTNNNFIYTLNGWSNAYDLINDGSTGKFINTADWDDNGPGLFTGKSEGNIYRIKLTTSPGTLQTVSWTATSAGAPSSIKTFKQSNGQTRLFCGTDAGKLYVCDDAWATSPSFTNITGTINAGNISDVYNLRSGDTIAVALSNYGINNVYLSLNGGSSWTQKENNLPNQPVWGIVLNPNKIGEAVVATETGVYGTSDIFASSPVWSAYTEGMGAVKVLGLRYRNSDKVLMAVTHGRGIFTSDAWAKSDPIARFGSTSQNVCTNQSVGFKDSTLNDPTKWEWLFSPATVVYLNGTDSSSQNPVVRFTKGGNYSVTLIATNSLSANILTKNNYIKVTDTIPGKVTLNMLADSLCLGDSLRMDLSYDTTLNGSFTGISWKKNSVTFSSGGFVKSALPAIGDAFSVTLVSNAVCVSPTTITTNIVKPVVLNNVSPMLKMPAGIACGSRPLVLDVVETNTGTAPIWSWYLNDTLQAETSGIFTINNPLAGSKIYATAFVAGKCILPANLIHSDTISIVINPIPPTPVVSRHFDSLFASNVGSGTYTWFRNGQVTGSGRSYVAQLNGTFNCVYTENGCGSDSSASITIANVGVRNYSSDDNGIWPVPALDELYISEKNGIRSLEILSVTGQRVSKGWTIKSDEYKANGSHVLLLSVSGLKPGNYVLKVYTDQTAREYKLVKQ